MRDVENEVSKLQRGRERHGYTERKALGGVETGS